MSKPTDDRTVATGQREPRYTAMRRVIICPACNSEDVFAESYDEDEPIYECPDCGAHFTKDETDKVYEEIEGND